MGKFKKIFDNYLDNHGDKPLCECPMEVQLLAFGMFLGRNAEQSDYIIKRDELYTLIAEYYEEEIGDEAAFARTQTKN